MTPRGLTVVARTTSAGLWPYGDHRETGSRDALTQKSHGLLVSYIRAFCFQSRVTPIEFLLVALTVSLSSFQSDT